MALLNDNYLKLKAGYLFPEIGRRVKAFCNANPEAAKQFIRCGIGDVTEPLPQAVIAAMHKAVDEMAARKTFRGYGPEQGYDWLRAAIAKMISATAAATWRTMRFLSATARNATPATSSTSSARRNKMAISDPVYPVYVDTNVMAGHTGEADEAGAYAKLVYLPCKASNGFIPEPPKKHVDVIYLCSPNNPTGAAANRPQLEAWVKYALEHKAIIIFDAAYEAYIRDDPHPARRHLPHPTGEGRVAGSPLPHSIYEIPGARNAPSNSAASRKTADSPASAALAPVVPKSLDAQTKSGEFKPLHPLWLRRTTTKFNGVSYIVQRGAEALYSPEASATLAQSKSTISWGV